MTPEMPEELDARVSAAFGRSEGAACAFCRDEAEIVEVIELLEAGGSARVRAAGCVSEVALDLVEGVRPGDRLVIHVGFAIARLERFQDASTNVSSSRKRGLMNTGRAPAGAGVFMDARTQPSVRRLRKLACDGHDKEGTACSDSKPVSARGERTLEGA